MNKKSVKLTESDLHRYIVESINKVLNEAVSDNNEMGTDEEFDAFMKWAMTKGSDMFGSAANQYVNNGDESKLYMLSMYYAKESGLNQNVAFNIAKEAAEGMYGFLGGMEVIDTRNIPESKNINKKLSKLTESHLHKIIKESVNKVLKESEEVENKIKEQCSKYKNILVKEFSEAQKAVSNSSSTFHNGIAPSLRSKGYTVISNGDNWVSFCSPSRLFSFYACSFGFPWKMRNKITMNFSNYTWKERYQYPNYYHTLDYKQFELDNFESLYMKMSNEIGEPVIIKPIKVASEQIETYKKFTVYSRGGRTYEELKEFDNFEDARKYAYECAKEKCEHGKALNDSTSRYYCSTPRDITKQHSDCAVAYEYYDYDEHSYYYSVEAE